MAYRVTIPIILGTGRVGLTLTAKLYDTSDVQVGGDISTGFTEIGLGNYAWDYSSIPANFRGWVKFYSGATLEAFTTIVPEAVELVDNLDASVSSRLAAATYVAPTNADPLQSAVPGAYAAGSAGYTLGQLAGASVIGSLAPTITDAGDLEIVKGQDYLKVHANQIVFTNSDDTWPDLGNANVVFHAFDQEFDMEVLSDENPRRVGLDLAGDDTQDLVLTRYSFYVTARLADGSRNVIVKGRVVFT